MKPSSPSRARRKARDEAREEVQHLQHVTDAAERNGTRQAKGNLAGSRARLSSAACCCCWSLPLAADPAVAAPMTGYERRSTRNGVGAAEAGVE